MRIIKRLYIFILKSFLPLFAMTFFIVLFIVLMQFLWKYIDDLVGKGLSLEVLGELFFYAAVSMVPMALPLAILLASLMTFGNFGERFELTAMKASGISLLQAMKPLIVFISFVAVGAFFFQNDVLPKAQVKMWTLLFSARQKSPELEIPEGVFYDQIPGYNLFVREKNRNTGILHGVMIYANNNGSSNTTILLADSAQMATTKDFRHLYLHLFKGEQFENLREQNIQDANVPFRRESFYEKEVLIPFDANFNRIDEGGMRSQYIGKNMDELNHSIDSIGLRLDSLGKVYATDLHYDAFPMLNLGSGRETGRNRSYLSSGSFYAGNETRYEVAESTPVSGTNGVKTKSDVPADKETIPDLKVRKVKTKPIVLDTLLTSLSPAQQGEIFRTAHASIQRKRGELEFRAQEIASEKKIQRRHQIELLKKFTLSVACLIFFFIGAPLGAIIRKGGLGTPLVISVLLFLVYYIIDNTGYKMARDGHTEVWLGMWLSTIILAPLSIYVTYKAMNDSAVFDKDRYVAILRRMTGIRTPRTVAYKEVIINEVDPVIALKKLRLLQARCRKLTVDLQNGISYRQYWEEGLDKRTIGKLSKSLEGTILYLSDSRDLKLIDMLSNYPEFRIRRLYHPINKKKAARFFMWFVPIGYPVFLLGSRAVRELCKDLRTTLKTSKKIESLIKSSM